MKQKLFSLLTAVLTIVAMSLSSCNITPLVNGIEDGIGSEVAQEEIAEEVVEQVAAE